MTLSFKKSSLGVIFILEVLLLEAIILKTLASIITLEV